MAKWQKGQSGNPGGRPQGVMAYVQQKCGTDAKGLIDALLTIIKDKEEATRDRIRALEILLDRGWNKPMQGMHISGDAVRPLVIDTVKTREEIQGVLDADAGGDTDT